MKPHYFLVTGSRNFPQSESSVIYDTLDEFKRNHDSLVMINGGASGADTICNQWAYERSVPVQYHPANWDRYGRAAGPIRNTEMLKSLLSEGGTSVFAFFYGDPGGSKGTSDMVYRCEAAGLDPIRKVVQIVQI